MLSFIYAIDKNGIIGAEAEGKIYQPIISRVDRAYFKTCTAKNPLILGYKTLVAMDQENKLIKDRPLFVIINNPSSLDNSTKEYYKNKGLDVAYFTIYEIKLMLENNIDREFLCIGGAKTFLALESLVDRHLVTEFDVDLLDNPDNVNYIHYKKIGNCKTGYVSPGYLRISCKSFIDDNDPNNIITGCFAEYAVV